MKSFLYNTQKIIQYNLKIIFGNKFVYFLGATIIFYFLVTGINLFSDDAVSAENIYFQLIFPAILLVFFPTTFGIQNDEDTRILEILFGIPNYRYKVWLVRLVIIFLMVYIMVIVMTMMSNFILTEVPIMEMASELMAVILVFGTLGFLFSTMVRNGNGTAVVMVAIGLILWFLSDFLGNSKWNIFLNPFSTPSNLSETVWETMLLQNRLILICLSVVSILWGLINLQKREKFIR